MVTGREGGPLSQGSPPSPRACGMTCFCCLCVDAGQGDLLHFYACHSCPRFRPGLLCSVNAQEKGLGNSLFPFGEGRMQGWRGPKASGRCSLVGGTQLCCPLVPDVKYFRRGTMQAVSATGSCSPITKEAPWPSKSAGPGNRTGWMCITAWPRSK